MKKIDALGGAVKAIEQQYFQNEIAESAYQYQKAIDEKQKIIVGVNEFVVEETHHEELLKVDESIRDEQIKNLMQIKQRRDNSHIQRLLSELKRAAATTENLLPHILYAVEAYATVGEISDALREVWGVYE